ncbi:MAG: hypothetical protein ABEJ74_04535 [Haloferacaceae archaeon]
MVSTRTWGLAGILIALAGVAVIAPDMLHSIQEGFGLEAIYGLGVLVAALVVLLVVGGGTLDER